MWEKRETVAKDESRGLWIGTNCYGRSLRKWYLWIILRPSKAVRLHEGGNYEGGNPNVAGTLKAKVAIKFEARPFDCQVELLATGA